eukprot:gene3426-4306_t
MKWLMTIPVCHYANGDANGTPDVLTAYVVESVVSFTDLSISAFEDETFNASFRADFAAQMAAAANVSASEVLVDGIASGSVNVNSTVFFVPEVAGEGGDFEAAANSFALIVETSPDEIFTADAFEQYGNVSSAGVLLYPLNVSHPPSPPPGSPPPSPPPPPPIGRAFIDSAEHAQASLTDAVSDENITEVLLIVDVALQSPVATLELFRALQMTGDCANALCKVDGAQEGPLFEVLQGGDLTLTRLSLTNFSSSGNGGALKVDGGSLLISECTLSLNRAEQGGAIYSSGGAVTVTESTMMENSAERGGAVYSAGAGSTLTVTGCNVTGNVALSGDGGALLMLQGSHAVLQSSALEGNTASELGGALHLGASTAELTGVTVGANRALSGGAVAVVQGAELQIGASTALEGNTGDSSGGALYCAAGDARVYAHAYVSISSNAAEQGGALFIGRLCHVEFEQGAWLYGNVAKKEGGGIMLHAAASASERATLRAVGVEVVSNRAEQYSGGGISAAHHSVVELNASTVADNLCAMTHGGGIYALNSAVVAVANSSISGNSAEGGKGGGVFLWGANATLVMRGSSATGNRARIGGGLAISDGANASLLEGSRLEEHVAEAGGAVYAEAAHVMIQNSSLKMNTDGAVHLSGMSSAAVGMSVFEENVGSAVVVGNGSEADFLLTKFTLNAASAAQGAGMVVQRGGAVTLTDCDFEENRAADGAALHVSGDLHATGGQFEGNTASRTAAVHLVLHGAVTLSGITFVENVGQEGGALYLVESAEAGTAAATTDFAQLLFRANQARGGGSVLFWVPVDHFASDASQLPPCEGCTYEDNTAAYTSSQGEASSTVSLRVAEQHNEEAGGYSLETPIEVEVVDLFGSVVVVDNTTKVVVRSDCEMQGEEVVGASRGVATVYDLTLTGEAGTGCTVSFGTLIGETVVEVGTTVPLRVCEIGEAYTNMMCVDCPVGSLTLTNDTALCYDCTQLEGMQCTGGAGYSIENGYWLAPAAQHCDTASCFGDKLYECDFGEACSTTSAGRSGVGAEAVASLQLCATDEGYIDGVLCGGTGRVVCGAGFDENPEGNDCWECPAQGAVVHTLLMFSVLIIGYIAALLKFGQPARQAEEQERSQEAQALADLADAKASHVTRMLGLLLGYLQVIGLMGRIYPDDVVPDSLKTFTSYLALVSLSPASFAPLVGAKCFSHELGAADTWSRFELSFTLAGLLPVMLVLCNWALIGWFMYTYRTGDKQRPIHNSCIPVTLFLLVAVHPSVATVLMQQLLCDEYWYTDADGAQAWLRYGSTTECFDLKWRAQVLLAVVTGLGFVVMFPIGVGMFMTRSHCLTRCRMLKMDLVTHWESIQKLHWHPVDLGQIEMLLRNPNKWTTSTILTDAAGPAPPAEKGSADETGLVTWQPATEVASLDTPATCIDIYLAKKHLEPLSVDEVEDPEEEGPFEKWAKQIVVEDTVSLDLGSSFTCRRLGTMFVDQFKDTYFLWLFYEMIRRYMQTAGVVLVQLMLSVELATIFAFVVSIVGLVVHLVHRPFLETSGHLYSIFVLGNQLACQAVLVLATLGGSSSVDGVGPILVLMQVLVIGVGLGLMYPREGAFKVRSTADANVDCLVEFRDPDSTISPTEMPMIVDSVEEMRGSIVRYNSQVLGIDRQHSSTMSSVEALISKQVVELNALENINNDLASALEEEEEEEAISEYSVDDEDQNSDTSEPKGRYNLPKSPSFMQLNIFDQL